MSCCSHCEDLHDELAELGSRITQLNRDLVQARRSNAETEQGVLELTRQIETWTRAFTVPEKKKRK